MAVADELDAAIDRILQALAKESGGVDNPSVLAAANRDIRFIEDHLTFAELEIARLKNLVAVLFGPRRTRADLMEQQQRDVGLECSILRGKVSELRRFDAAKLE